ncbi:hypothetical protein [Solemya velum gill symbiont]|nr:hypothetical protein [Solemya velum gill symbiont]
MVNKRVARLSLGLILLVVVIFSFIPRLYVTISSDGIINAHTTTLRSHQEGVLAFDGPVTHGRMYEKDQLIGTITNERINRSYYHELATEKVSLERRVETIEERLEEFAKLDEKLALGADTYKEYTTKLLEQQVEIGSERLVGPAVKLEGIQADTYLGEGHNDIPYSSRRLDQMVIEKELAKTAMFEAKRRIEAIADQMEIEDARLEVAKTHAFKSPFKSIVWRMPVADGATIVIDSELIVLLDATNIFLDIAIDEAEFSNVQPGDEIEYRLIGETVFHKAKVFALRGSGSILGDINLAGELEKDPKREFRIWARPNLDDLQLSAGNYYQVGRRIEVKIPREQNWEDNFIRLFNVF